MTLKIVQSNSCADVTQRIKEMGPKQQENLR
jgi:hypothetical protein